LVRFIKCVTQSAFKLAGRQIVPVGTVPEKSNEYLRLEKWPRYKETATDIIGRNIELVDARSFLWQYDNIWSGMQYSFNTEREIPIIIDCGANIGLSVIFWKRLFPSARVIAFEPDPGVYEVLVRNVSRLRDVETFQRAVWISEGEMLFSREGADSGSLTQANNRQSERVEPVKTIRLRDHLDMTVDMLKIDIEGAEADVILDCADRLSNVRNLFVEYHSFVNERQRIHEILSVLVESGFRLHILHENAANQPFIARNSNQGMDMQLGIFAYRE
jgi:FkbM family methyltransferase